MGLLDRLKSMMSEMTEEEKKEFFEEIETSKNQEPEEIEEKIDLPDEFECELEDVERIINIRDRILELKASYADLCIQTDNKKEKALEEIHITENVLLGQVEAIKEKFIPVESERDNYVLTLNLDPELSAKLIKQ